MKLAIIAGLLAAAVGAPRGGRLLFLALAVAVTVLEIRRHE